MIRKAVVPVAGWGTRMLPLTRALPKEILPLGRKPVIHHVVDELIAAGIDQILFVTAPHKQVIEAYFDCEGRWSGEGRSSGETRVQAATGRLDFSLPPSVKFECVQQVKPAGNGDAIRLAESFAGEEPFVVAWGDTIIHSSPETSITGDLIEVHQREDAACTIAVEYVDADQVSRYGMVRPVGGIKLPYEGNDADDLFSEYSYMKSANRSAFPIDDIVEKPSEEESPSRFASSARYICDSRIFSALNATPPGQKGELWLADAIRTLLKKGHPVWCVPLGDESLRYDIGTPGSYWEAFTDYALRDEQDGPAFRAFLQGRLEKDSRR